MQPAPLTALLCAALLLAACAAPAGILPPAARSGRRDFLGNEFPAECADLSGISLPVIPVITLQYAPGEHGFGLWRKYSNGDRAILVLKGLSDKRRAEVIEHELTHECMYLLTGSPEWHRKRPAEAAQ